MQLVSVIMGTYNPSESIFPAVKSILTQTYSNFEFIICDDGTNDSESLKRLVKVESMDPRIIVIFSVTNNGLADALNRCILRSKSELLIRMDDDDVSHPDRIKELVKKSEEFPNVSVIGTWSSIMESDGNIWGQNHPPLVPTLVDAFKGNAFIHSSVLLRKESIKKVGLYRTSSKVDRLEDYDLWIRLYMNGKSGINIGKELYTYNEDYSSLVKRSMKFRLREFKLKLYYLIHLKLFKIGTIFVFKPLILIFVPNYIYKSIRAHKMKK